MTAQEKVGSSRRTRCQGSPNYAPVELPAATLVPRWASLLSHAKTSIAKITSLLWHVRTAAWHLQTWQTWYLHAASAALRTRQRSGVIFAIDVFLARERREAQRGTSVAAGNSTGA